MRITVLQNIHKKNLHTFTISWFSSYCIHTSDSTSSCRAYTLHNVYDSQSCDLCDGNRLKIILNIYIEFDHLLFSLRVGVSGGVICFSSLPLRMDSISCSRGVGVDFRGGPNWRSEAWGEKTFSLERRDRERERLATPTYLLQRRPRPNELQDHRMGILLDTWWYISVHHYLAQLILSVCGLETNNKEKKRKRNFSVFSNCVRLFSVVCCLPRVVVTIVLTWLWYRPSVSRRASARIRWVCARNCASSGVRRAAAHRLPEPRSVPGKNKGSCEIR